MTSPSFRTLLTRARWIEVARILMVCGVVLLFQQGILPLPLLLGTALIHLGPDILVFLNSVKLLRVKIRLPVVPQEPVPSLGSLR